MNYLAQFIEAEKTENTRVADPTKPILFSSGTKKTENTRLCEPTKPIKPVLSLVPPAAVSQNYETEIPDAYDGITGEAMLQACLEAGRRYPKWTSAERHTFARELARLEAGAGDNDEKVRLAHARGQTSNGLPLSVYLDEIQPDKMLVGVATKGGQQ